MDASRRARRRCHRDRLVAKQHQWPGLKAIAKVVRRRETGTKPRLNGLLPAQPSAVARAAQSGRSTTLEHRKQPALAAGRGHERGSGSDQNGTRTDNLAVLRHMASTPCKRKDRKAPCAGSSNAPDGTMTTSTGYWSYFEMRLPCLRHKTRWLLSNFDIYCSNDSPAPRIQVGNLPFLCSHGCKTLGQAGPPFQTDDPTPVDLGHYEFYVFGTVDGTSAELDSTGPAFEFNWGAIPNIQLHAILPFGVVAPSNNLSTRQAGKAPAPSASPIPNSA